SMLPKHHFADVDYNSIKEKLASHHHEIAALFIEPIVQNAGGIRFYSPELLKQMRKLCNEYDVLLIVDEIATGFGRTGKMFACEHANIQPDIMCVGKALTGGYMSLAAVLTDPKISEGIHEHGDVLMHGPTFMANPLACAVANTSIELLLSSPWQQRVQSIEKQLTEQLEPCRKSTRVADVRVLGAIGVVEMKKAVDVALVQAQLIEQGVWLRPFGKLIYTMPSFVMVEDDISQLTAAMRSIVEAKA
ncbi:MAG: aminotransferase class III-fold pyridoxal phosphate-dependent enzyme, partial [Mariprofundaceae bacterium]